MTAVTADAVPAEAAPRIVTSGRKIGNRALALLVFLGGFVIFEPAPYELFLILVMGAWAIAGLKINRFVLPLVILLIFYLIGGLLALSQVESLSKPLIYFGTSALLALSAIFYAAIIPTDPANRLNIIMRAYVAAAVAASVIGILGYFGGIEFLTLYHRARGPFQDPNVFAPFLMLPFVYSVYRIFTNRLREVRGSVVAVGIILLAIFLSFSRGAWGMAVVSLAVATAVAFVNQRKPTERFRVVTYVGLGVVVVVALVGIALVLPATAGLFEERAQLVQSYDGGELGRFDRHALGFMLAFDRPLGLGPFEFGNMFGEDEHEMWLKGFIVYGWLGGFSYIALAIWTVIISFPLLFKPRAWQPVVVCAFSVLIGHLVLHFVIDNDHWRHLYLIYGILWGAYAAERMHRRGERRASEPSGAPLAGIPVYRAALPRG